MWWGSMGGTAAARVWVKGPQIERGSSYSATAQTRYAERHGEGVPREVAAEVGVLLRATWPI